jgi:hypothetical protein
MCDVLLPPGVNPTAVKYIYIYIISTYENTRRYIWGDEVSGLYYEGAQFESLVISPDILVEIFFFVNFLLVFFPVCNRQDGYSRRATSASFHIAQSFNGVTAVIYTYIQIHFRYIDVIL